MTLFYCCYAAAASCGICMILYIDPSACDIHNGAFKWLPPPSLLQVLASYSFNK